ncbi:MAG: L-threonylcarbamoyladenylate synthase [Methylophilaceae bacterium]
MQVDLAQAIRLLKRGEVVAIPTETVYGLAADATNEIALRQIYTIKQRPADNPLIIHMADASQVADWAIEFPSLAQKLAQAFWPGPFTLVLKAKESVSKIVRGNLPTVALRVPSHAITLELLQQSDLALAAPSANKFTQLSPTTAAHVRLGLGDAIPVLDGGACTVGIESTIVSVDGDNWQLLRLGMISEMAIEIVAGKPAHKNNQLIPKAPGQYALHYSPRTPIRLFASRMDLVSFVPSHQNSAAMLFGKGELPKCSHFILSDSADAAAESLYSTLHQLDALSVAWLLVEMPPDGAQWLAIRDRLSRAAYKN